MTESSTLLPTKIMACIYGLACIALAFAASSMGGVLQASLTIFGVVGGPLLAVFTLGVSTVKANQRGVLTGLLLGFTFAFWIGFGGPKPPTPILPLADNGCGLRNSTLVAESLKLVEELQNATATTTEQGLVDEPHFFWLYRLSYLWYSVIGFSITMIFGYGLSLLYEYVGWADNSQIYLDLACKQVDYDLFVPLLAKKLKQNAAVSEELDKLNNCQTILSN